MRAAAMWSRRVIAVGALIGLCPFCNNQLPAGDNPGKPPAATTPGQAAPGDAAPTFAWKADAAVFSVNGKTYTVADVERLLSIQATPTFAAQIEKGGMGRKPTLAPVPLQPIEKISQELAAIMLAGQEGAKEKLAVPERLAARAESGPLRLSSELWRQKFLGDPPAPSEEAIKARYEKDRQKYRQARAVRVRSIFLSTYVAHTTREGETLESLAQSISGDPAMKDRILDAKTKQPRSAATKDKEGREVPPRALLPGEELMVPMGPQKVAEVEVRAKSLHERLKKGEEFVKVAQEASESPMPGQLMNFVDGVGRPMMKEMADVVDKLKDGEFSEPIRIRHGFQILYRESVVPESYFPLERVKGELVRRLNSEWEDEFLTKEFSALLAAGKGVVVDESVLAHSTDRAFWGKPLVKASGGQATAEQFQAQFKDQVTTETSLAERKALLPRWRDLRRALLPDLIRASGIEGEGEYKLAMGYLQDTVMSEAYLDKVAAEATKTPPSEDELKARYAELQSQLKVPFTAEVWQMTIKAVTTTRATEEQKSDALKRAMSKLTQLAGTIHSLSDFETVAARESEDQFRDSKGKVGSVGENFRALGEKLKNARPDSLLGPFDMKEEAVLYWVGKTSPEKSQSLDEAKDQVVASINQGRGEAAREKARKELLARSDFKFLLTAEADASPNKGGVRSAGH